MPLFINNFMAGYLDRRLISLPSVSNMFSRVSLYTMFDDHEIVSFFEWDLFF